MREDLRKKRIYCTPFLAYCPLVVTLKYGPARGAGNKNKITTKKNKIYLLGWM